MLDESGVLAFLREHNIAHETVSHEPCFTVDDLHKFVKVDGVHGKNLFLKVKKKKDLYLVVAEAHRAVKLDALAAHLGKKKGALRFADESVLFDTLGVKQGSVTVLALANDMAEHRVTLVLDAQLLDGTHPVAWFHPLVNDKSTALSADALRAFLAATGHEPVLVDFAALE